MMSRSALVAVVALIGCSGQASAQLRQPRCGGWPPLRYSDGMVIGGPGETCYGQVFERGLAKASRRIISLAVKAGPAQGTFRLIGDREFEYTPNRTFKGMDRIVLHGEFDEEGRVRSRDWLIRATTVDEYEKAGGDRLKPPEGSNVNRAGSGSKTRR